MGAPCRNDPTFVDPCPTSYTFSGSQPSTTIPHLGLECCIRASVPHCTYTAALTPKPFGKRSIEVRESPLTIKAVPLSQDYPS